MPATRARRCTRRRVERTHDDVLNLHTGFFSVSHTTHTPHSVAILAQGSNRLCCPFFFGVTVWSKSRLLTSMEVGGAVTSAAKRRRERRMRSWWRHEAQSIRAAVATVLHHSCDVGRESYYVPRHQKMATAREDVVNEPHDALRGLTTPLPGELPGILPEPVPQRSDRTVRRFAGAALPTLGLLVLAGALGEAVDPSALSFLVRTCC